MIDTFDTGNLTTEQMKKIRVVLDELNKNMKIIYDLKTMSNIKVSGLEEYKEYSNSITCEQLKKQKFYLEMLNQIFEIEENYRKNISLIMFKKHNSKIGASFDGMGFEKEVYIHQKKHGYDLSIGAKVIDEKTRQIKKIRTIVKKNFGSFVANLDKYYDRVLNGDSSSKLYLLACIITEISYTRSRHI